MNKKNIALCLALMFFGAGQSLVACCDGICTEINVQTWENCPRHCRFAFLNYKISSESCLSKICFSTGCCIVAPDYLECCFTQEYQDGPYEQMSHEGNFASGHVRYDLQGKNNNSNQVGLLSSQIVTCLNIAPQNSQAYIRSISQDDDNDTTDKKNVSLNRTSARGDFSQFCDDDDNEII